MKVTNEIFVALAAIGDIENLTQAQLNTALPNPIIEALVSFSAEQASKILADYAFNRKYYPEWSKSECFWEAVRETVQTILDIGGMVPLIGEVCDLTNAAIYNVNGDALNASLSLAGSVPGSGWAATGSKYAIKVIRASTPTKRIIRWIVKKDGSIDFGRRNVLRKVLNLTDASKHAHHIIPWELANHPLVQKAAKSADAFHLNDLINGMPINSTNHLTGHAAYNSKISDILSIANAQAHTPAYQKLSQFTLYLRNLIAANPNANLGQIASLINYMP